MNILFLGPDGVGKSTLVNGVYNKLQCTKKLYLGMGSEGWVLFNLHHYNTKERSFWFNGIVWAFLYWYILLPLEFLFRCFPLKKMGSCNTILIDRFPGTPFIKGGFQEKLYKRILPQPDLIILLIGDAEVITQRKPNETTIDRTVREINKWRIVADRLVDNDKIIVVDTTKMDIDSCVRNITKIVQKLL